MSHANWLFPNKTDCCDKVKSKIDQQYVCQKLNLVLFFLQFKDLLKDFFEEEEAMYNLKCRKRKASRLRPN